MKRHSMTEKSVWPQQPVISIRISDSLRLRLEKLKEILTHRSGESVSTSEAAKQLLESAREDRLETAELLANATTTLAQARRKVEAGLSLGRAEWIVLAYYAFQGVESHIGRPISRETLKAILEAFLAAYRVRRGGKSSRDAHYLAQLPYLDKRGNEVAYPEGTNVETVLERLIERTGKPNAQVWPQFAARNLYELLEEERFGNLETLNEALKPHWPALWRAAARGHYLVLGRPVRNTTAEDRAERFWGPTIPSVFEGGFVLSFATGGEDLSVLISLPNDRQAMYEVGGYPKIVEFRQMLTEWDTRGPNSFFRGRWFLGYTAMESTVPPVWIRCDGSTSFGFGVEEWVSLQVAFRRAWETPILARIWSDLTMEYGEI
jgi:hypothetical protein